MKSILVKHLAKDIGMDKSNCLKLVKRLGITPHRLRTKCTGGQAAAAVTNAEAKAVIQYRVDNGFTGKAFTP